MERLRRLALATTPRRGTRQRPTEALDAAALVRDYGVMLRVAAAALGRRPAAMLARWLPRLAALAALLALLHLVGGYRLAFATDG